MKYPLPIVALAVASIELAAHNQESATATAAAMTTGRGGIAAAVPALGAGGLGGTDANWYLRAPDGSFQGPYGLSQLWDWSNAGYVPLDSPVHWGMGGTPRPLSTLLGEDRGRMRDTGAPSGGKDGFAGGFFDGGDGGRLGDDASSEEGGFDYRAWQGRGLEDDSDDEIDYAARRGVTAVEGGRWSESVAAAKGALSSLFKPTRRNGRDRYSRTGTSRSSGGSYYRSRGRSAAAGGGRGNHFNYYNHQSRPPYGGNPGVGYGGPQDYSGMGLRGQAEGKQGWISEPRSASGQVQGRGENDWSGRDGIGRGVDAGDGPDGPREAYQPLAATDAGEQRSGGGVDIGQNVGLRTEDSMYPPPRSPPPPPPGQPWDGDCVSGGDNRGSGDGGHGTTANVPAAAEMPLPPQQQPSSAKVFPSPAEDPGGEFPHAPRSVVASGASTSGFATEKMGGLDPKEVEEFYAKQKMDYDGDGIEDGTDHAKPRKKRLWGKGSKDLSREELRALGLDYGDSDGARPSEPTGRSKAGKISVDSMKLRYMEGWHGEAEDAGLFSALRGLIGSSILGASLPAKAFASLTPVASARVLARAVGVLPLALWWTFSVAMGLLPATIAWFGSRLLARLSEATGGRYTFSPAEFQATRSACLELVGQQLGAGLLLASMAGIERGWLRQSIRERSAGLARRALAYAYVAGGNGNSLDRPSAAHFRELSIAPWAFTCEAMELWRALVGVAASAAFLHLVWPVRGPIALGGGAAALVLVEGLSLLLGGDQNRAAVDGEAIFAEELAGGVQGGAVSSLSFEAETRGLKQVLLEKRSSLLAATGDASSEWRRRVVTVSAVVRGLLAWAATGAGIVYFVLAAVEEELAFHFGGDRVALAASQVWLAHASLQRALRCMGQLSILRPSAAEMNALGLRQLPDGFGFEGVGGRAVSQATKQGWADDGPDIADGLRLEGVSYTPPGRDIPALSRVSLHAPAGSVAAVVGGAGVGKTTLLQLVLGLIEADAGEARFQGRPVKEWDTSAFRGRVAWLNQVAARFALTAGENIGAGDPAAFSDRQLWKRAASLSGASASIESLPMGYDTPLKDGGGPASVNFMGSILGSGLSEGEWQRVQLSRFFMRAEEARLLLLDEPFKGIDPAEAVRILAALKSQARATGQVVLVASQDLPVGRWADITVLLENGSVTETGSWDELLGRGGYFAAALRKQEALCGTNFST